MANITAADVREVIGSSMPDSYINAIINLVYIRIGGCLSANYSEETANLIVLNLVAYYLDVANGKTQIASENSPNGASISYQTTTAKGLAASPFGQLVLAFDSSQCYLGMVVRTGGLCVVGPSVGR